MQQLPYDFRESVKKKKNYPPKHLLVLQLLDTQVELHGNNPSSEEQ
jgi:hypothetical protein